MSSGILDKLFSAMFTDNVNERRVACDKLVAECMRHGYHPADIKLLYGKNLVERQHQHIEELSSARDRLEEHNAALKKEIELLRKHATPQARRRVREEMIPPKQSKVFVKLITEKLFAGRKPKDWHAQAAIFLKRSEEEIRGWERSSAEIPEFIINELQSAAPVPPMAKPRGVSKSDKRRAIKKTRPVAGKLLQPPLI